MGLPYIRHCWASCQDLREQVSPGLGMSSGFFLECILILHRSSTSTYFLEKPPLYQTNLQNLHPSPQKHALLSPYVCFPDNSSALELWIHSPWPTWEFLSCMKTFHPFMFSRQCLIGMETSIKLSVWWRKWHVVLLELKGDVTRSLSWRLCCLLPDALCPGINEVWWREHWTRSQKA